VILAEMEKTMIKKIGHKIDGLVYIACMDGERVRFYLL
jgi:hypothetical protein